MHTFPRPAALVVAALACVAAAAPRARAADPSGDRNGFPDPARLAGEIAAFVAADSLAPPPAGAIVCVGSSSLRMWHATIAQNLAPLTVVPRGFGGSTMLDALHYADRILLPYRPRAVVLYEGDNDVAEGVAPDVILTTFRELVGRIRTELPACRLYFLSIKPSPSRWPLWPRMQAANALIRTDCAQDSLLAYVDVASAMLDADGEPRPDIYLEDKLHMNRAGYALWRDTLRPVLLEREGRYEAGR